MITRRKLILRSIESRVLLGEPFAWTPEIDLVDVNGEFVLTAELLGARLTPATQWSIDLARSCLVRRAVPTAC
jgi:hypothetical protein